MRAEIVVIQIEADVAIELPIIVVAGVALALPAGRLHSKPGILH